MKSTNNIHPGKILQEEFLIPLQITATGSPNTLQSLKPEFQKLSKATEGSLQTQL